ncbi:ABC transporter permease [Hoeflea prorocentri]|uniref:ABC transporter permease n=1 Tax=Hoeflea prorocentri TaxID=1922333 RepID=A0A9X3UIK8_9HYPH|nr:ABC transporter permease [Hoeflea prorocentri]MCY6379849.1 ABC transporter permease [Hoeflea prorocentri]MDA5397649.1 ABC transporter permease [Hoeflea prorocentri]
MASRQRHETIGVDTHLRQVPWIERSLYVDIALAFRQRKLAAMLHQAEIAEMRRGTGLGISGPFISTLLHIAVLGLVMATVFNEPIPTFIPYFSISFAIWQTLAASISRMANASERATRYIGFPALSSLLIYLVDTFDYAVGLVSRLAAALVAILAVNYAILLTANFTAMLIGVLFNFVIVLIWAPTAAFIFDKLRILRGFLPQILLLIFLITPIFYTADRLSDHRWIAEFNPIYHLLQIVRVPVINGELPVLSLLVAIGLVACGFLSLKVVHRRQRISMVYGWVS